MPAQQFKQLTGFYGFDIIESNQEVSGYWYAIQLFGISDGANVSFTIDNGSPTTLAALGANIPNGLILYNKFISILIDSVETSGSAILYRMHKNTT